MKSLKPSDPVHWDSHQTKILQKFSNFTVQASGLKDINLVQAWRGIPPPSLHECSGIPPSTIRLPFLVAVHVPNLSNLKMLYPDNKGLGAEGDTYYSIGESNHLTPKELEKKGINVSDPGYFGRYNQPNHPIFSSIDPNYV